MKNERLGKTLTRTERLMTVWIFCALAVIGVAWWLLPSAVPSWVRFLVSITLGGLIFFFGVRSVPGIEAYGISPTLPDTPTAATSSRCTKCGEPFGKMASLGFEVGGYLCGTCGKRVCDHCCYLKAKSVGRSTMLCPHCGGESMKAFTV